MSIEDPDFSDGEFYKCTFRDCELPGRTISSCKFEKCRFERCNLATTQLMGSSFIDCKFDSCRLSGIDWSLVNASMGLKLVCNKCDLSYSMFIRVNISRSQFTKCKILEVDFTEAVLRECEFSGSDMMGSRFNNTDLQKADFRKVRDYVFNPAQNKCKGAKFSRVEAENLLLPFGIEIDDESA